MAGWLGELARRRPVCRFARSTLSGLHPIWPVSVSPVCLQQQQQQRGRYDSSLNTLSTSSPSSPLATLVSLPLRQYLASSAVRCRHYLAFVFTFLVRIVLESHRFRIWTRRSSPHRCSFVFAVRPQHPSNLEPRIGIANPVHRIRNLYSAPILEL